MTDYTGGPTEAEAGLSRALTDFDTATLHESYDRRGAMPPGLHSLVPGKRIAGRALTVACPPGDNLHVHVAVAAAQPGDVLVVQTHDPSYGIWGEVLTVAAMAAGIAGLVVDGSIRDIDSILQLGFPVFARGTAIQGAVKMALGTMSTPISCGGVLVRPGDYIVADDSGVLVLDPAAVGMVLDTATSRRSKEAVMMQQLRSGKTTMDLLNLHTVVERLEREAVQEESAG